jgi:hypothetical protein
MRHFRVKWENSHFHGLKHRKIGVFDALTICVHGFPIGFQQMFLYFMESSSMNHFLPVFVAFFLLRAILRKNDGEDKKCGICE